MFNRRNTVAVGFLILAGQSVAQTTKLPEDPSVNAAIANQISRSAEQVFRAVPPSSPIAQTTAGDASALVQAALNYFEFDAGRADGVFGRQTTVAIREFQNFQGYDATGKLTVDEQDFLIAAHSRALREGALTNRRIVSNADGVAGLLTIYAEDARIIAQRLAEPPVVFTELSAKPAPAKFSVRENDIASNGTQVDTPRENIGLSEITSVVASVSDEITIEPQLTPKPLIDIENLTLTDSTSVSGTNSDILLDATATLEGFCNEVYLRPGGFVSDTAADNLAVLDREFCVARTYAISKGAEVESFDLTADVSQLCQTVGDAMTGTAARIGVDSDADILKDAKVFIESSDLSHSELVQAGQYCLSDAYLAEDMSRAIAMSVLLTAAKQEPYAELVGHHLVYGRGVDVMPDAALDWFNLAVSSVKDGAQPVFAPARSGRMAELSAVISGGIAPLETQLADDQVEQDANGNP